MTIQDAELDGLTIALQRAAEDLIRSAGGRDGKGNVRVGVEEFDELRATIKSIHDWAQNSVRYPHRTQFIEATLTQGIGCAEPDGKTVWYFALDVDVWKLRVNSDMWDELANVEAHRFHGPGSGCAGDDLFAVELFGRTR